MADEESTSVWSYEGNISVEFVPSAIIDLDNGFRIHAMRLDDEWMIVAATQNDEVVRLGSAFGTISGNINLEELWQHHKETT